MSKSTKFKKQKAEAIRYLSSFPLVFFNRFTKEELIQGLNTKEEIEKHRLVKVFNDAGYLPRIEDSEGNSTVLSPLKTTLETKKDLIQLLTHCFEKTLTVKLNLDQFLVNIKIFRESKYYSIESKKIKYNEVWFDVSLNMKKMTKFACLDQMKPDIISEMASITEMNNRLCRIFGDCNNIHPSLLSDPCFKMSNSEIFKMQDHS